MAGRTIIAVPFYVGRPDGWQPGDAVFDHPTPLGSEPTLPRLLDSLRRLATPPRRLVVVVVVAQTHPDLASAADAWARDILSRWLRPEPMSRRTAASRPRSAAGSRGARAA